MDSPNSFQEMDDAVLIEHGDIHDYNPEQVLPEDPATVERIRKWLEPTDYDLPSGEFRKHLVSHVPGTGTWLTSSEQYRQWLESEDDGLFWIRGFAGSGKSVMAAHIIDELNKSNPNAPVLFFFFRQIIDANHEPVALLRDWQAQVLSHSPPLQQALKKCLRGPKDHVPMEAHWKNLRLALDGLPGKVFCIVDALDEMNAGNEDFLKELGALGQWKPGKVKVLMTSRPVPTVETPLRACKAIKLRLEDAKVNKDISTYVQDRLNSSSIDKQDWNKILDAVPGRADGLFIYAKLAMDAFLEPGARVDEVLQQLPTNLNELYTNLLHQHAQRAGVDGNIQLQILQWVTHSTRPLRLLEIADLIDSTIWTAEQRNLKRTKGLVRAAIGPLLEVFPDETVCVVHHSFTEFLKGSGREEQSGGYQVLKPELTHLHLAMACLAYLRSGCLDDVEVGDDPDEVSDYESEDSYCSFDTNEASDMWDRPSRDEESMEMQRRCTEAKVKHAFLAYASGNWITHIQRAESADEGASGVLEALDYFLGNASFRKPWLTLQWTSDEDNIHRLTPLHVAARYGLSSYASHLLWSNDVDIDATDGSGRTALWFAAKYGHVEIVRTLLDAGADSTLDEHVRGLAPIHIATLEKHAEAVKVLLEAGTDPLMKRNMERIKAFYGLSDTGSPALMYACREGDLDVLEAYLPYLKDTESVNRALSWSAKCAHANLVRRLLQHPEVDINTTIHGHTPLILACGASHAESIMALLEAGADPTICGDEKQDGNGRQIKSSESNEPSNDQTGYTPLHAIFDPLRGRDVSRHCSTKSSMKPEQWKMVINALVDKGVNINKKTKKGKTALKYSSSGFRAKDAVQALLEAGAEASDVDNSQQAPLQSAFPGGLFGHGAPEGTSIAPYEPNSLLAIDSTWNTDNAQNRFPDIFLRDENGKSALHHALSKYAPDPEQVKRLLESGADPLLADYEGNTCLHGMQYDRTKSEKILKILVQAGANVNAKNFAGETPLFKRCGDPHVTHFPNYEDLQVLVDHGADIHTRDYKGRTLLHAALGLHPHRQRGSGDTVFHYLVKAGVDPLAVDFRGNTLLHDLAHRYDVHEYTFADTKIEFWQYIMQLGVRPNEKNIDGRTPLHIQCSVAHSHSSLQSPSAMPFLDFVLSLYDDLNIPDRTGVTPLHLAVTVSNFTTKKLLEHGAKFLLTNDGLTPIHLAARARESNTLGLLLERVPPDAKSLIDSKDSKGLASLYYACKSGVPESVKLLMDAGATVTGCDLFQACAEFEPEQEAWMHPRHAVDKERNRDSGGLSCDDLTRPALTWLEGFALPIDQLPIFVYSKMDAPRLEEILYMITDAGADGSMLDTHIVTAAKRQRQYTLACLLQARDKLYPDRPMTADVQLAKRTLELVQAAELQAAREFATSDINSNDLVIDLLKRRRYAVLEAAVCAGMKPHLDLFVGNGYYNLVDRIGASLLTRDSSKEGLNCLDVYGEPSRLLLHTALLCSSPNMEVLRLLVEKFHADVNAATPRAPFSGGETGLHIIAKGQQWWLVALALPYLLKHGANLEAKDGSGQTPLHLALRYADTAGVSSRPANYAEEVAAYLITAGADVNAMDNEGRSCLMIAIRNPRTNRLLLEKGAAVDSSLLIESVKRQSLGTVKLALDAKVDPNTLITRKDSGEKPYECPSLFYAALDHGYSRHSREYDQLDRTRAAIEVVETLLRYGADPFMVFERPGVPVRGKKITMEKVTLLHELILQDELVNPILLHPDLDFNHRDTEGRTVLHALCQHVRGADAPIDSIAVGEKELSSLPSFLEVALHAGADVLAHDNKGRNALHHLVMNSMRPQRYMSPLLPSNASAIAKLASSHPSLLNVQDQDGKTPLHLALDFAVRTYDTAPAEALLAAGADATLLDNAGNNALHILSPGLFPTQATRDLFAKLATTHGVAINAQNLLGLAPAVGAFSQPTSANYTSTANRDLFPRLEMDFEPFAPDKARAFIKDVCKFLTDLGADLQILDHEGRGLLHHVGGGASNYWFFYRKTYFQALMEIGFDPFAEDKRQRTAVDVAVANGDREVLALFGKDGGKAGK